MKTFRFLLLFPLLFSLPSTANPLSTNSLILVHTSKHYHTDPQTIEFTRQLPQKNSYSMIVALTQNDHLWYGPVIVDQMISSHHGEHALTLPNSANADEFVVTVVGGYHSACLGWTLAELIERFSVSNWKKLVIHLPMKGIFTGFLRDAEGSLLPLNPENESWADNSVDGLNLSQATLTMKNDQWTQFMVLSLKLAVFDKAPFRSLTTGTWRIILKRNGQAVQETGPIQPSKQVVFDYL
jgi:hypothetical protein